MKIELNPILQKKKKEVTRKPDQKINDFQELVTTQMDKSLIAPLQPEQAPKKEGRRLGISPTKYRPTDMINHNMEEDNRLARKHEFNYETSYNLPQLRKPSDLVANKDKISSTFPFMVIYYS